MLYRVYTCYIISSIAAVSSARDSNATHLQNLQVIISDIISCLYHLIIQGQLSSMSEEAGRLVKKHEVLELHNDILM